MKTLLIAVCVFFCVSLSVKAQIVAPTTNKIIYTTNTVEFQDSVLKTAVVVRKNNLRISHNKYSGTTARVTAYEPASRSVIWSGAVRGIRIVGVIQGANAAADSAKVLSLKTTPFN